jgi:hypothetical protein
MKETTLLSLKKTPGFWLEGSKRAINYLCATGKLGNKKKD